MKTIGDGAFKGCYSITDIICHSANPPQYHYEYWDWDDYDRVFEYDINDDVTLHVPKGSLEAYQTAEGWENFAHIVDDVEVVKGDVNGDGRVDIDDVNAVQNLMLGRTSLYSNKGDVNGDGNVDVDDMNIIINIILGIETEPEKEYTVNGVRFKMINVKGSTFTMGATAEQSGASANEKPTHQVTLSSYAIGETPVTQALWQAVMGNNPSYDSSDPLLPVEQVSWNDCQTFIN